jgi:peptidoglycan/LPS O-acetylase OafA/YrhL
VRALAGFLVFFHHHPVFNLLAILLYEAIESPANRVLRRTVRPPVRAERAA